MKTIEYRTLDKGSWLRGEWDDEPDKKQWQDKATGLPCLVVRNGGGAWCGYVGVPVGHPDHGKDYDSVDVEVHGGLTFASKCVDLSPLNHAKWVERQKARRDEAKQYPRGDAARDLAEFEKNKALDSYEAWEEYARGRYICHLPEPGESDDVWWLGFDCAHSGDCSPAYTKDSTASMLAEGRYRTLAYVEGQVRSLAKQLAARR